MNSNLITYDYFFYYKFVCRFLLMNKNGSFLNTNQIPEISHSIIFFDIKGIRDLDDLRSLNYFYLVNFFFGKRASFIDLSSEFHLGLTFFHYRIFTSVGSIETCFSLGLFVNDFYAFTSRGYFAYNIYNPTCHSIVFNFKDMNLFLEKKNNMGFYFLRDSVKLNLIIKGTDDFLNNMSLAACFKFFSE